MKKIIFLSLCVISLLASCDDNTDTLGGSLTNTEDLISVSDGVFKVTSRSIVADSVLSRSITGYLGNVKDPETGTYIKSDFTFIIYNNFIYYFYIFTLYNFKF